MTLTQEEKQILANEIKAALEAERLKGVVADDPKRKITTYLDDRWALEQFRDDQGIHRFAVSMKGNPIIYCTGPKVVINQFQYEVITDNLTERGTKVIIPPQPIAYGDTATLFEELRAFYARWGTVSAPFLTTMTGWTMSTYIYDLFDFFGYLRFLAPQGKGKTRILRLLHHTVYHGRRISNFTPATIYREIERYHCTHVIDEMPGRLSGVSLQLMRDGTNFDGEVPRIGGDENEPQSFSCYSPKACAGQEGFADATLASRVILENLFDVKMADHVPLDIPPKDLTFLGEAKALQAKLLRWRFDNIWTFSKREPEVCTSSRQRQVFRPIFSVTPTERWEEVKEMMARQLRATQEARAESDEGEVVEALRKLRQPEQRLDVYCLQVSDRVNLDRGLDTEAEPDKRYITERRVASILSGLGFTTMERDTKGNRYRPASAEKLSELIREYCLPDVVGASSRNERSE